MNGSLRSADLRMDPHDKRDQEMFPVMFKCGHCEEPRTLIRAVASDLRELRPNSALNRCCGGGLITAPGMRETGNPPRRRCDGDAEIDSMGGVWYT